MAHALYNKRHTLNLHESKQQEKHPKQLTKGLEISLSLHQTKYSILESWLHGCTLLLGTKKFYHCFTVHERKRTITMKTEQLKKQPTQTDVVGFGMHYYRTNNPFPMEKHIYLSWWSRLRVANSYKLGSSPKQFL